MSEAPLDQVPIRPQDTIDSFITSKGSVYTYSPEGYTTRFKTVTGEAQPTQDLTVFVDMKLRDLGAVAGAFLFRGRGRSEMEVTQQLPDGTREVVTDVAEVKAPDTLAITTFRRGKILRNKPVSLFPRKGAYVYDSRRVIKNGATKIERHLGHKVATINPTS